MTDLSRLLGHAGHDPGCDECFPYLDQYVEAQHRGEDAALAFPDIARHLRDCDACREDTEGLLALLADGNG